MNTPLRSLCLMPLVLTLACGHRKDATLKLSGNIETIQVAMSFRTPGRILERPVDEGFLVKEGQLIARLDSQDLAQQAAAQQAAAATAQAALAALEAGSRPEEIQAAKATLDQAEADYKRLEPDDARIRDLQQKGILSVRDYESTHASFVASKAKVDQARQQYQLVKKGPRKEDIDQARARLAQAREASNVAQTQLGYATLKAPFAGVVLSKNAEAGEYVAPGTSVVTLANLGQVWLRAYLEEEDLGRVKVGQKAWILSDSYPGKRYEGRVAFIASEAEFTPKSVQTRKERAKLVYRIKVDVPNPAMELKPGMPADAEIELGAR